MRQSASVILFGMITKHHVTLYKVFLNFYFCFHIIRTYEHVWPSYYNKYLQVCVSAAKSLMHCRSQALYVIPYLLLFFNYEDVCLCSHTSDRLYVKVVEELRKKNECVG
jgi:hypothetical protein